MMLALGVFVVAFASLFVVYSRQANQHKHLESSLAEAEVDDDGLDVGGLHLGLPAADGGHLGGAQEVGAIARVQGVHDHAELRVGQDAA